MNVSSEQPGEYYRIPGAMHGYEESGFFTANVVGQHTPADRLIRFAKAALR
jgi:hypothetical protein